MPNLVDGTDSRIRAVIGHPVRECWPERNTGASPEED